MKELNWRGWREYELAMKIKDHYAQLRQTRYPFAMDFEKSKSKRLKTMRIRDFRGGSK